MNPASPGAETGFFGGRARRVACSAHVDERGRLQPFYFDQLPFLPCRVFAVADVPAGTARGGHAHRSGLQLLFCLQGCIEILLRWRQEEVMLVLEPGSPGLLFGPGVWCRQTYRVAGSVLLAFASEPHDPASYVGHGD